MHLELRIARKELQDGKMADLGIRRPAPRVGVLTVHLDLRDSLDAAGC